MFLQWAGSPHARAKNRWLIHHLSSFEEFMENELNVLKDRGWVWTSGPKWRQWNDLPRYLKIRSFHRLAVAWGGNPNFSTLGYSRHVFSGRAQIGGEHTAGRPSPTFGSCEGLVKTRPLYMGAWFRSSFWTSQRHPSREPAGGTLRAVVSKTGGYFQVFGGRSKTTSSSYTNGVLQNPNGCGSGSNSFPPRKPLTRS